MDDSDKHDEVTKTNSGTNSKKMQIKVASKKMIARKSVIKVKRRRSTSKINLASGSSTSSITSEGEQMHKFYRVKSGKVVKSVSKQKIKVKKLKTPVGEAIAAENTSIKSFDSAKNVSDAMSENYEQNKAQNVNGNVLESQVFSTASLEHKETHQNSSIKTIDLKKDEKNVNDEKQTPEIACKKQFTDKSSSTSDSKHDKSNAKSVATNEEIVTNFEYGKEKISPQLVGCQSTNNQLLIIDEMGKEKDKEQCDTDKHVESKKGKFEYKSSLKTDFDKAKGEDDSAVCKLTSNQQPNSCSLSSEEKGKTASSKDSAHDSTSTLWCELDRKGSLDNNKETFKVKVPSKKQMIMRKSLIRVKRHRSNVTNRSNSFDDIATSVTGIMSPGVLDQANVEVTKTYYHVRPFKVASSIKQVVKVKRSKSDLHHDESAQKIVDQDKVSTPGSDHSHLRDDDISDNNPTLSDSNQQTSSGIKQDDEKKADTETKSSSKMTFGEIINSDAVPQEPKESTPPTCLEEAKVPSNDLNVTSQRDKTKDEGTICAQSQVVSNNVDEHKESILGETIKESDAEKSKSFSAKVEKTSEKPQENLHMVFEELLSLVTNEVAKADQKQEASKTRKEQINANLEQSNQHLEKPPQIKNLSENSVNPESNYQYLTKSPKDDSIFDKKKIEVVKDQVHESAFSKRQLAISETIQQSNGKQSELPTSDNSEPQASDKSKQQSEKKCMRKKLPFEKVSQRAALPAQEHPPPNEPGQCAISPEKVISATCCNEPVLPQQVVTCEQDHPLASSMSGAQVSTSAAQPNGDARHGHDANQTSCEHEDTNKVGRAASDSIDRHLVPVAIATVVVLAAILIANAFMR